jgi:DNA-binding CsgD family transcriptional regulator
LQAYGHRSLQIIDRFEAYRLANPNINWNPDRALVAATVETMRDDPHSVAAELFLRRIHPQFALTRGEQELLELALEGMDDDAASKALNISLPAIKHRWANVFERVAAVRPELCPQDGSGTRGIQKRQRILAHVRKHPEELRPFDFSKHESK